jgi:hypothetical protein
LGGFSHTLPMLATKRLGERIEGDWRPRLGKQFPETGAEFPLKGGFWPCERCGQDFKISTVAHR